MSDDEDGQSVKGLKPVTIEGIAFNDGTLLDVAEGAIVLFVGANNVGKSQSLRDIASQTGAINVDANSHSVATVELKWEEAKDAAKAWFRENVPMKSLSTGDFFDTKGHRAPLSKVDADIDAANGLPARTGRLISIFANAEERLLLSQPAPAIDLIEATPSHPIHVLANDQSLMDEFSELTEQAFGSEITLDLTAGNSLILRVGRPEVEPDFGRHGVASREYADAIRRLP